MEEKNANLDPFFLNQIPLYRILVKYKVYLKELGWQEYKENGKGAGSTENSSRIEAIKIEVPYKPCEGGISYRVKISKNGWTDWINDEGVAGVENSGRGIEHIEIKLTGELGQLYDVNYRTHSLLVGWQKWVKNGEKAGLTRIEMIQIFISPKLEYPNP